MRDNEKKDEFIRLRAEGYSFGAISEKIGVSKSTLWRWEKQLTAKIADSKAERLRELYHQYGLAKAARIEKLGKALNRLETALDNVDLSTLPPDKLLDYYLRYREAMSAEYVGIGAPAGEIKTPDDVLDRMKGIINRLQCGDITREQAKAEADILSGMIRTYDAIDRSSPFHW